MRLLATNVFSSLQHSYGFIQCCERQARLFFHFSQFDGNIEHLKIGDPVEFEVTYDRRNGKPIASSVSKIAPEVVRFMRLHLFQISIINVFVSF
jgi:cold shock CspA family protein